MSATPVEQPGQGQERIAAAFHEAYERLAPAYGYATRPESAVPWESVPLMNKRLMVAVTGEVLAVLLARLEAAEGEGARLREALADLLDTVERGDEFKVRERSAAAREALAQSEGLPS